MNASKALVRKIAVSVSWNKPKVCLIRLCLFSSSTSELSSPSLPDIKTTIREINQILQRNGMKYDKNFGLAKKILGLKILESMNLQETEKKISSLRNILPLSTEELFVFLRSHPTILKQSEKEIEAKIRHFKRAWYLDDAQIKQIFLLKQYGKYLNLTTAELKKVNQYYKENFKLRVESDIRNSLFSVWFWKRYLKETSNLPVPTISPSNTTKVLPLPDAVMAAKEEAKRIRLFFREGYDIHLRSPFTEVILIARVFDLNSEEDLHKKLKLLTSSLNLSSKELRRILLRIPVILNEPVKHIQEKIAIFSQELAMSSEEMKNLYLKGSLFIVNLPVDKLRNHIKLLKEEYQLTQARLKRAFTDPKLRKTFESLEASTEV